jgi:hypothetical protein
MPIPVLTIIIIILILWLQYEVRKSGKRSKQSNEAFWQNEKSSNLTNRKDITNLDFITISPEQLPMKDHEDQTINSYRDTILTLADKKIVNLTGFTNTELKFKYGAANINILAEYDSNYTVLVSILHKWAERLHTQGFTGEAISVLQYAITCSTDVTKSYKLLAQIYKDSQTPEKINELLEIIPKIRMLDKDKLLTEVTAIKNS